MQIITEVEQGSPEWLALRLGIVTCSELECLLTNGKGEAGFGVGAFSYMNTLIGERITGEAADPFQGNRHTERGHELEGVARKLYEQREEVETNQVANGGSISRFGMYAPPTAGQRANVIADRIESHNSSPIWQRETQTEMAL